MSTVLRPHPAAPATVPPRIEYQASVRVGARPPVHLDVEAVDEEVAAGLATQAIVTRPPVGNPVMVEVMLRRDGRFVSSWLVAISMRPAVYDVQAERVTHAAEEQ